MLVCIVLTASYGGAFYADITRPVELGRIHTLHDLNGAQKEGKITVFGIIGGIYYNMIKESRTGVTQEIGHSMQSVDSFINAISLLKKSAKPLAFILTKEVLAYSLHRYGIRGYYIPDNTVDSIFTLNYVAIPMPNDFPYKHEFNKLYIKMLF
ncbi:unnamed protein product [Oppiella nova]|uniref:Uncharacterized protein n=1 Tax=Oppiella nova TaxID=334625 RepID=A0A7R9MF78_9ACAR|nr:unnamed protein product [Oppiella nova]CAG2175889.1 unnamed protein product [Oppiella nova]